MALNVRQYQPGKDSLTKETRDFFWDYPEIFVELVLGAKLTDYQQAIIRSVRENRITAVKSCHGTGKTFLAAIVALWFVVSNEKSKCLTTAPTLRQVTGLIWREIRGLVAESDYSLNANIAKTSLEFSENHYLTGATASTPEGISGLHAPGGTLIVVDEATGIAEEIYAALSGSTSGFRGRLLMISNPTKRLGPFWEQFRVPSELSKNFSIDIYQTPNFITNNIRNTETLLAMTQTEADNLPLSHPALTTPVWAIQMINRWGLASQIVRVRVLGLFPSQDEDAVIPYEKIEEAMTPERKEKLLAEQALQDEKDIKVCLGSDPSRGGDESVIIRRTGNIVTDILVEHEDNSLKTVSRIRAAEPSPDHIGIDAGNMGAPIADMLRLHYDDGVIIAVLNHQRPTDKVAGLTFATLDSQLWWILRENFINDSIYIPPDDVLLGQLSTRRYTTTKKGDNDVIVVQSKKDWTKEARKQGRTWSSPDRAEALAYCFANRLFKERETEIALYNRQGREVVDDEDEDEITSIDDLVEKYYDNDNV